MKTNQLRYKNKPFLIPDNQHKRVQVCVRSTWLVIIDYWSGLAPPTPVSPQFRVSVQINQHTLEPAAHLCSTPAVSAIRRTGEAGRPWPARVSCCDTGNLAWILQGVVIGLLPQQVGWSKKKAEMEELQSWAQVEGWKGTGRFHFSPISLEMSQIWPLNQQLWSSSTLRFAAIFLWHLDIYRLHHFIWIFFSIYLTSKIPLEVKQDFFPSWQRSEDVCGSLVWVVFSCKRTNVVWVELLGVSAECLKCLSQLNSHTHAGLPG